MTITMKIDELRRLEAEATPGPWDVSGLTVYDTCMDSVASTHSAADAALIVAMRNALPELLKALETPVAWRTRQRVGPYAPYSWVYTDKQAVTSDDDVYETMPPPALPPHGGVDVG